jgi:hypothetical protein
MGRSIRDDAIKAEAELLAGVRVYGPGQHPAAPDLVGRIYRVGEAAGLSVAEIEQAAPEDSAFTIH